MANSIYLKEEKLLEKDGKLMWIFEKWSLKLENYWEVSENIGKCWIKFENLEKISGKCWKIFQTSWEKFGKSIDKLENFWKILGYCRKKMGKFSLFVPHIGLTKILKHIKHKTFVVVSWTYEMDYFHHVHYQWSGKFWGGGLALLLRNIS